MQLDCPGKGSIEKDCCRQQRLAFRQTNQTGQPLITDGLKLTNNDQLFLLAQL